MHRSISRVCAAPRCHLFTRSTRLLSSSHHHLAEKSPSAAPNISPFGGFSGPSPLRLPEDEQKVFEELQRQSTGAFSTPRTPPRINQSPDSSPEEHAQAHGEVAGRVESMDQSRLRDEFTKAIEAKGKGEELHPNVRRGAQPEFEGEVNPKTGEVGGPKNEPLRWGAAGEWSYNGRTTDF